MNNSNDILNLERQRNVAHYMLLATVIATVINILLLLTNTDMFIPYCAALPYYLTMLGNHFDGYTFGTYTATGLVMAFVVLAIWLLIWWKAKTSAGWLKAGMIAVIIDTVLLAIFAFVFLEDPGSCLAEGLLHIAIIYEIYVGLSAGKKLRQIQTETPVYAPWSEEETPADSEYSDEIE